MNDIFGELNNYECWTDDVINVGDIVTITNFNCEFEYDNKYGTFANDLQYCYVCDLELLNEDLSSYEVDKSNNGGAYAYAKCRVLKVHEKTY